MAKQIRNIVLTENEKEALIQRIELTDDLETVDRLRVVWFKVQGLTHKEIAVLLCIGINTVTRHLKRYLKGGLELLCRTDYTGSNPFLTLEQRNQVKIELIMNIYNTAEQVVIFVEKKYGVIYSVSGMQKLLKRLGFTYKKNRLIPSKCNPEDQIRFVKLFNKIRSELGEEDRIYFVDAFHAQHNSEAGMAWSEVGIPHLIPTNTGRKRCNVLGAFCTQTHENIFILTEENINQDKIVELLGKIHENHQTGKIFLVLDNAPYNHAGRVCAIAEFSCLYLVYQPPYSPNLNLIERLWKFTRKKFFKDKYRSTFKEFKEKLGVFFGDLSIYKKELSSLLAENFEIIPSVWQYPIY